jgi:hypothetical protein
MDKEILRVLKQRVWSDILIYIVNIFVVLVMAAFSSVSNPIVRYMVDRRHMVVTTRYFSDSTKARTCGGVKGAPSVNR